jgi:hypothetical protein
MRAASKTSSVATKDKKNSSFLKKRSKKLLFAVADLGPARAQRSKSFLVHAGRAPPFFKKERLALFQ